MSGDSDPKSNAEIYQLRIRLQAISPMIWRRIWVRSDSSIAELHETMQCVMGWSNEHLHRFVIRGVDYGANYAMGLSFLDDGNEVRLSDFKFRIRERFLYEYDMIDHWQHEIRFEKRLPFMDGQVYPTCIDGRGATPPEDCGGPDGFMVLRERNHKVHMLRRLAEILSTLLADEETPIDRYELQQVMYWYEIDKFNRDKANQRLADHRAGKLPAYILGE